jgi:hypothetical protein
MTEQVVDAEIVEHGTDLELAAPQSPTLFGTDDPVEFIASATRTATALANVVRSQRLIARIGQSDHVRVEGWTLLGSMLGVYAVTAWTRPIERDGERWGWEARVEARDRVGALRGAAEAQCTRDERMWKGRDDYALRSMAQTRATSKALRQPLGFVMQLAGFNPTPAEEMSAPPQRSSPAAATEPADIALEQHADRLEATLLQHSATLDVDLGLVREAVAGKRSEHASDPELLVAWLEQQVHRAEVAIQARSAQGFESPLASKAQQTLMLTAASKAGLDDDARHALVERVTGQPSTKAVGKNQVQAVLDAISEVPV